ncbi:hypothetical protein EZS27_030281 [termite gut metagenome]|uniref:Uncharacterized protein n=1 Tax=termite gut metagenome TaxID=433724 RepID=A0A5J4QEC2_9ZZZZ
MPSIPPTTLPIEIKFEIVEDKISGNTHKEYRLTSVKHEEKELFDFHENNDCELTVNFLQFSDKLQKELCVPNNMLRLSKNIQQDELKKIIIPWEFQLLKKNNNSQQQSNLAANKM